MQAESLFLPCCLSQRGSFAFCTIVIFQFPFFLLPIAVFHQCHRSSSPHLLASLNTRPPSSRFSSDLACCAVLKESAPAFCSSSLTILLSFLCPLLSYSASACLHIVSTFLPTSLSAPLINIPSYYFPLISPSHCLSRLLRILSFFFLLPLNVSLLSLLSIPSTLAPCPPLVPTFHAPFFFFFFSSSRPSRSVSALVMRPPLTYFPLPTVFFFSFHLVYLILLACQQTNYRVSLLRWIDVGERACGISETAKGISVLFSGN